MTEKPRAIAWSNLWREGVFYILLGGFLLLSLANFQGKRRERTAPTSLNVTYRVPEEPNRTLASVEESQRTTHSVVLGCMENESIQSLQTSASLIQIQWQKCSGKVLEKLSSVHARNKTTGEVLLLLENETTFFTHYFPLTLGKNEIFIQSGKKPKTIEVIRN